MLSLIPLQYKLLVGAIVAVVLLGGAYLKGRESGLEKYHEFKSAVEAANAKVAEENAKRLAEAKQNTELVERSYTDALGNLANSYHSRFAGVRSRCGGQAVRTPAASTSGLNAGTAHAGLDTRTVPPSEDYEAIVKKLELDAAKTTMQLIYLQEWAQRVCK